MKRHKWTINNNTCHVHTMRQKKGKCNENIESIRPLTRYISPRYGGHGVMEGYEET